jgi:16S rRNA (adenine1518-N6/adenine1519-N6)-dimethyltransferase
MMSSAKSQLPPPRKSWGQNFIFDPNIILKIIRTIDPGSEDVFLEIGPGRGELTFPLVEQVASIIAVELDPKLVDYLGEVLPAKVQLIHADILDLDFEESLPAGYRIYGSLPYYITTPILFRVLEHRSRWSDAYFIIQREVAERMAAAPGGKEYGRLSVMLQACADIRKCFDIPAAVFRPKPKVDSTLIQLVPGENHGHIEDDDLFATLVRLAFGQRRKKLSNALKSLEAGGILEELGLANVRAEQVSVAEFIRLSNALSDSRRGSSVKEE